MPRRTRHMVHVLGWPALALLLSLAAAPALAQAPGRPYDAMADRLGEAEPEAQLAARMCDFSLLRALGAR